MENYQMNRSGRRPYQNTCGTMRTPSMQPCMPAMANTRETPKECGCRRTEKPSCDQDMFSHLRHLPVAMGYVPRQTCDDMFDLNRALCEGTLFKTLCKPFCGRRGGCR